MTNPIIEAIQASGITIYRLAKNRLTGQTGNQNTQTWQAFNPSLWAQYVTPLAEDAGSGFYWASRPAWELGSLVSDVFYQQAGGSPAITDKPPFLLAHGEGENIAAINADPAVAPQAMQGALSTTLTGAVQAGTITNSVFPTNLGNLLNNLMVGRTLYFTSGALKGAAAAVLSYTGSTGVIGIAPMVAAPSVNDTFEIQ